MLQYIQEGILQVHSSWLAIARPYAQSSECQHLQLSALQPAPAHVRHTTACKDLAMFGRGHSLFLSLLTYQHTSVLQIVQSMNYLLATHAALALDNCCVLQL